MSFQVGETIGPYRIIEQLGQGGMATVFKAYHAKLDRYVAIKALHPAFKEDPNFLARFQREARVVARLEHPNIVPIYDYSEHEGRPFLVMKFIEGETLKSRLTKGPLQEDEIIHITEAVGAALAYAHEQGILHRDIKPSNVLLAQEGQIYLADFGLARIASAGASTLSSDMLVGTPQYISPEQAKGNSDLDEGTDIYSFGVLLYELVVGRVPFTADTPYSIIHDHIYSPLPLPSQINPQVPEAVEHVLLKALAKERQDRFSNVSELVEAFTSAKRLTSKQGINESVPSEAELQVTQPEKAAQEIPVEAFSAPTMAARPAEQLVAVPIPEHEELPSVPEKLELPGPAAQPVHSQAKKEPLVAAPLAEVQPEHTIPSAASMARKPAGRRNTWLIAGPIILVIVCVSGFFGMRILKNWKAKALAVTSQTSQPPVMTLAPTLSPLDEARQAVEQKPDNPYAHYNLARALLAADRPQEAQEEYERALDMAGNNFNFYTVVGDELANQGMWVQAAQAYIHLTQVHPKPMPVEMVNRLHETLYKSSVVDNFFELIPEDVISTAEPIMAPIVRSRYVLYHEGPARAEVILTAAFGRDPDVIEARLVQAEIAIQSGFIDRGRLILNALVNDFNQAEWLRVEAQALLDKTNP